MANKTFRHYYLNCDSKEYYNDGICKECKNKKVLEHNTTEKGKSTREKYTTKQRLVRRTNRIKEVTENLKSDVEILGLTDHYLKELEQLSDIINKISNMNLHEREYRKNDVNIV